MQHCFPDHCLIPCLYQPCFERNDLNRQQQLLDLHRKGLTELSKIIPPKKVAMLLKAERDFKMELLRKMKDRGMPPPPPDDED